MKELIKIVALKDQAALAAVRNMPGLMAAMRGDEIWIRGIMITDKESPSTAVIPITASYRLNEEGLLFPPEGATPVARLEQMHWQPLKELLTVKLPVAAYAGATAQKHVLTLSAAGLVQENYATLVPLDQWIRSSVTMPEARLKEIKFAVSSNGRVLILNSALLSIPGKQFWRSGHLLLPLGWDIDPPLLKDIVAAQIDPSHSHALLFDAAGGYEKIPYTHFTEGSRRAIQALSNNAPA